MLRSRLLKATVVVCVLSALPASVSFADDIHSHRSADRPQVVDQGLFTPENFVCGTRRAAEFYADYKDQIAKGLIPDPSLKLKSRGTAAPIGLLYRDTISGIDVYQYPDQASLLLNPFSSGQLFNLMSDAAAELITEHGDQFDFIAFWLNYGPDPGSQIGAAFYLGLENDISGIGEGFYSNQPGFGLPGFNTEGYVMMWNVYSWQPGAFGFSAFTRLVLGQEFEHRWACFINPIVGGRNLQGDDGVCGRSAHWSFAIDGQGSGMEIPEFVGTNPAVHQGGTLNFNTDIGGVFSYTDLYLMGYVSPSEMDAGNSELRFFDGAFDCPSSYSGPIFNFNSSHIAATNGTRLPNSTDSQKHYKTGWVMFYLPGNAPDSVDLARAINIMKQHEIDWKFGVLDRGTMDNSIDEGHFSSSGVHIGQGSQTIQFTYDTTFEASAWAWDFGDGNTSTEENPSHTFAPGLYNVELIITTPHDDRQTLKKNLVTLWADTVTVNDLTVPRDTGNFYWEINMVNKVPVEDINLPITVSNVQGDVWLDSMSTIGCRTSYFEYKQIVYDNRGIGQLAYRMRADNGQGSAPMPAGSGPIARVWLHTISGTTAGDTAALTVGPLGSQTFKSITVTATYVPEFDGGTIHFTGSCNCFCHNDPGCDGQADVVDVIAVINEAFRGAAPGTDPSCPHISRSDVDCDCFVTVSDVVRMIDVAFRGASTATRFCDPCIQPCP